ncbi:MAG: solute:sodium symporter family transporter, partial [Allomuricauda sp.]
STFNSALNSAATIFSLGIYKRYLNKKAGEKLLVRVGKSTSALLAFFAIGIAPFVAQAPQGLYQLLQQLNGIFFIPMATVILAGFFLPKVSATGAKVGLLFGLIFYITTNFILQVDLHYVHLCGIEFVLNILVMLLVSWQFPRINTFRITDVGAVELNQWRYAKSFSILLVILTLGIYVLLGNVG